MRRSMSPPIQYGNIGAAISRWDGASSQVRKASSLSHSASRM